MLIIHRQLTQTHLRLAGNVSHGRLGWFVHEPRVPPHDDGSQYIVHSLYHYILCTLLSSNLISCTRLTRLMDTVGIMQWDIQDLLIHLAHQYTVFSLFLFLSACSLLLLLMYFYCSQATRTHARRRRRGWSREGETIGCVLLHLLLHCTVDSFVARSISLVDGQFLSTQPGPLHFYFLPGFIK